MKKLFLLVICLCLLVGVANAYLADSITAYFKLDNSGVAPDDSGRGANGTVDGATWGNSTCMISGCYAFDGTNDYIKSIPANSSSFSINHTIAAWIKPDDLSDADDYIMSRGNRWAILWEFVADQAEFFASPYTGDNPRTNTGMTLTTSWQHVVYTYNGTHQLGYLNGSVTVNEAKTFNISPLADDAAIGAYSGGANWFDGQIDEVGFWDRALTPAEVYKLYVRQSDGTGLQYPFASVPSIDETDYDCTSCTGNTTAWRNDKSVAVNTTDSTPTINFTTDVDASCRIHTSDQNYSTMGSSRDCTTTGNQTHTCTLAAADEFTVGGYNTLYVGCAGDAHPDYENSTSTSGALNVSYNSYTAIGTLKYDNGTAIDSATVYFISESTIEDNANYSAATNSTGQWNVTLSSGSDWVFWYVHNSTVNATVEHDVSVP